MKMQDVPINKIRIVENHRTNVESTHLDELMQSIKQHGLMQPVGVAPDGKGKFVLRFGQRRYLACQKLGYKTIAAMVGAAEGEEKLLLENLTENMQRKDPSFAELGRVINRLEQMNLSSKQIAARLGLPDNKIKQIVEVYHALPEKYRKRIVFMEKGGGRAARKGMIPAQVATRIVGLKKSHGLKDNEVDSIVKSVVDEGMDKLDLDNVGALIGAGMSATAALHQAASYGIFSVNVVFQNHEVAKRMQQHGLLLRKHLFQKILYGELPPLPCPPFVTTGPVNVRLNDPEKIDPAPFVILRKQLLKLRQAGKMTAEQKMALSSTEKVPSRDWTVAQCHQIKTIYDDIVTGPSGGGA